MSFFLDTAELPELVKSKEWGFLSGVTSNPLLISAAMKKRQLSPKDYYAFLQELAREIKGLAFVQTVYRQAEKIIKEADTLSAIFQERLVIKIPFSEAGLKAAFKLKPQGTQIAVTAIFSPLQAQIAAENGADFVIPFCNRIGKLSQDGVEVIGQMLEIFKVRGIKTRVLAASLKSQAEILPLLALGVHHLTLPYSLYEEIFEHPLSLEAIDLFHKALPT